MSNPHKSPDRDAARQYRREAERLRGLAEASYLADVRKDLFTIAEDYEALAQQREAEARRYGAELDGADDSWPGRSETGVAHPRRPPRRGR